MDIMDRKFWENIHRLTREDRASEVPDDTVQRAVNLFQAREDRPRMFQMRPLTAGFVRKAPQSRKFFYELGDRFMVQLEVFWEEDGAHLSGVAHGFEDSPITLFGDEFVMETSIEAGRFEFKAVPRGTYALSFADGEDDYWINSLQIEEDGQ